MFLVGIVSVELHCFLNLRIYQYRFDTPVESVFQYHITFPLLLTKPTEMRTNEVREVPVAQHLEVWTHRATPRSLWAQV